MFQTICYGWHGFDGKLDSGEVLSPPDAGLADANDRVASTKPAKFDHR